MDSGDKLDLEHASNGFLFNFISIKCMVLRDYSQIPRREVGQIIGRIKQFEEGDQKSFRPL